MKHKFNVGDVITNDHYDYLAKITSIDSGYYHLILLADFTDKAKNHYPKGYPWRVSDDYFLLNYKLIEYNNGNKTIEELYSILDILNI